MNRNILLLIFLFFCKVALADQSAFELASRGDLLGLKKMSKLSVDAKNSEGETLLIISAAGGHRPVLQWLLSKKVKVNELDKSGHSALFWAVSEGHAKVVSDLLAAGAAVDFKYGSAKNSILFEAVKLGNMDVIKLLLSKSSDLLNQENQDGENVAFEAVRNYQVKVLKELIGLGLKTQILNKNNQRLRDLKEYQQSEELKNLL